MPASPKTLEVFHGAVDVMLRDGILTREEQRLVIKLAKLLGLEGEEPSRIYDAVKAGESIEGGRELTHAEQLATYERLYEVAIVNENLSQDEYQVIAYLRAAFDITVAEHEQIEAHLRKKVEETYEAAFADKLLFKMKESTGFLGRAFDKAVRRKNDSGKA